MTMLEVEGYSPDEPMDDDDWLDEVVWRMQDYWSGKREHDQNGYLCHEAGSPECLALGHAPNPNPEWPDEEWEDVGEHQRGFSGDYICPDTKYATACTECEGECLWGDEVDPSALWRAVEKRGES